jgi:hypothetical protein
MNSLLGYYFLQLLCTNLKAFDIKLVSNTPECGRDGWEMVYSQDVKLGGFPPSPWCVVGFCSHTPWSQDRLIFSDLGKYEATDGAYAFTMAWDDDYYMQWEQGENPVNTTVNSPNNWEASLYHYTLKVSEEMYQYGQMDFSGLAKSAAVGIMFDGRSSAGAWFAVGVSKEIMNSNGGIPGYMSKRGDSYIASLVKLWIWKPECGDWKQEPEPSEAPTLIPTPIPTTHPTFAPTDAPTLSPTAAPTMNPTLSPTEVPSLGPTKFPTEIPTGVPTKLPTVRPTYAPSRDPTRNPTDMPTLDPTPTPTESPTNNPSPTPTWSPSRGPTRSPTLLPSPSPSETPTLSPTNSPTSIPSPAPTFSPSSIPTSSPSVSPTEKPTPMPSITPTSFPTENPTTADPTFSPSNYPTDLPTNSPTDKPTDEPTNTPTGRPTKERSQVVAITNDGSVSLIIITAGALLLFIIFLIFTLWLFMTKRVPRFSLCEGSRSKSRKKWLNNKRRETESETDFQEPRKIHSNGTNRIELYVRTQRSMTDSSSRIRTKFRGESKRKYKERRPDKNQDSPAESEISLTDDSSIRRIITGTKGYFNEQDVDPNKPKILWSTMDHPSGPVPPKAQEETDSAQDSFSPIDSHIMQDIAHPSPIVIHENPYSCSSREASDSSPIKNEAYSSPNKNTYSSPKNNALTNYLTPQERTEVQENDFGKVHETRQLGKKDPQKEREYQMKDSRVSGDSILREGENSSSDSTGDSILKDLPQKFSPHLNLQTGHHGENSGIKIEIKQNVSPGEHIVRRRSTRGTRLLNNMGIADSYIVEPEWTTGEAADEKNIFGNRDDCFSYEDKEVQDEVN